MIDKQPSAPRTVAVIGAGASGLCAARYLKQAGFAVTIFEIGTRIGGLWCFGNDSGTSSAYSTLHINTAKNLTNFGDFPFPRDTQPFPSHKDMHAYFERYAERFGLQAPDPLRLARHLGAAEPGGCSEGRAPAGSSRRRAAMAASSIASSWPPAI